MKIWQPHHTKGIKNGTSSSLVDAHIYRGCVGKIEKGKIVLCRRIAHELMLSVLL